MAEFDDRFDARIAETMRASSNEMSGIPSMLGIEILRFEPGRLFARATFSEDLLTPSGNVHGGAIAGVLDHLTGAVIYPLMPEGYWGATTELKLNYIAPVQAGVVDADAHVVAMGRRTAVVRGELHSDGRIVCAAQGTITIVAPRGASS